MTAAIPPSLGRRVARVDYDAIADRYDAGRGEWSDALAPWRVAVEPYIPTDGVVLDVGSGTGIFAHAFARWFGVRVIGVEPSVGMRARALQRRSHPLVRYVAGRAECLPLSRGSCRVAWLSTVTHHVSNLDLCASEVGRALVANGTVVIRSVFPGRLDHIRLFDYFPGARKVAETFPTVEATVAAFRAAAFGFVALDQVQQQWAPSLRAYAARVRLRADSTLVPLTDEEFRAGLRKLDDDVAREQEPSPVVDRLDLLVLGRQG
jgi:ubiquinone/menaquinone biosynthesis C-methylase UbiE